MLAAGRAEEKQKLAALGLVRQLPPQHLGKNLSSFAKIAPHLETSLAPHINRPLKLEHDPQYNRYFICSDYNCDNGAYRSPWSNRYFPTPKDGGEELLFRPSQRLRKLEEAFNDIFDAYKTAYYEGGVSSAYFWDLEEGFAGAFLIQHELQQEQGVEQGVWNSVHILEVKEPTGSASNNYVEYRLSSTVLVHVDVADDRFTGEAGLGALLTRQADEKHKVRKDRNDDERIQHIGKMIEAMEIGIRQDLDNVYMAKQREMLASLRSCDPVSEPRVGLPLPAVNP